MGNISLCIRPVAAPIEWGEFCATHGPYAIALDGYVASGSRFDPSGPRLNLDHHAGVDRLATRATCARVARRSARGCSSASGTGGARGRRSAPTTATRTSAPPGSS